MVSIDGTNRFYPVMKSFYRFITLSCLLITGCDWPGQPNPADTPVPSEMVRKFWPLYSQNCSGCHGADGKLGPAPPLNDSLFLAIIPDSELSRVISEGRSGTLMPAWAREKGGPLSAEQVQILVKGIKINWKSLGKPEGEIPSYALPDGKVEGNKTTGAELFAVACASCHGDQGRGGKDAGAINNTTFLDLISDQALRRLIITGRPDLGMPGYNVAADRGTSFKPLTSKDINDLSALLASWRAGEYEPQRSQRTQRKDSEKK